MARHLPILEELYDRRLHADIVNFVRSDSFKGLEELGVSTGTSDGKVRDADALIKDVFDRLVSLNDSEKRIRLERVILGDAMSFAARKDFEEYCVAHPCQ